MTYLTRALVAPMRLIEIGEAARSLGVTTRTLRYYQDQGLVRSHRLARNVRGYDVGTVEQLNAIVTLRAVGLPIAAIRTILGLRAEPDAQTRALRSALDQALHEQQAQIARLKALANELTGSTIPPAIAGLCAVGIGPKP